MPDNIIRLPEVRRRTGLSKTGIYSGMKAGDFPKSVKLGKKTFSKGKVTATRAVGWLESEVDAWMDANVLARVAPETEELPCADVPRHHQRNGAARGDTIAAAIEQADELLGAGEAKEASASCMPAVSEPPMEPGRGLDEMIQAQKEPGKGRPVSAGRRRYLDRVRRYEALSQERIRREAEERDRDRAVWSLKPEAAAALADLLKGRGHTSAEKWAIIQGFLAEHAKRREEGPGNGLRAKAPVGVDDRERIGESARPTLNGHRRRGRGIGRPRHRVE